MPRSSRSFSRNIQHRQITGFVGREAQLALFRDNLKLPPDSDERRFLFSIHGDGGVGKTSLVARMGQVARDAGRLTATADDSLYDLPGVLAEIARQCAEQGDRLKRFEQRYAAYVRRTEDAEPTGGEKAASVATRGAVRMSIGAARGIPFGGILAEAVNPDTAAQRADDLRSTAARKWRNRDSALDATPVQGLARQLVEDLRRLDRPVALFFDTYERTAVFLDGWLRGLFDGAWGEPPADLVVTVAGRHPLDPNRWSAYLGVQVDMPLAPFTAIEARQLLAQQDVTDERVIETIMAAAGGLPLSLAMLAANRPADPAAVRDVTGTVVERFLQWAPDEAYEEVALLAALPRHVDRDVLGVLGAAEAYGWLSAQPFVSPAAGRCHYHDVVRGPMLRLFRTRSAQGWRERHAALASAYREWRAALTGGTAASGERRLWLRSDWQEKVVEEIYHALCADPAGALPAVLGHAVQACRHSPPTARRLVDAVVQAGRDTGDAELQALGDRLQAALPGADGEWLGYLDVLLACPQATVETRANAYRERGRQHRFAERYDRALDDFGRALRLDPDYVDALAGRATTYHLMGRYDDALADLDRVIELDPGDDQAIIDRVDAYRMMDRYDEALADAERVLERDPASVPAIAARGQTYQAMERYDDALAEFTRAIELDPGQTWIIADRGETYRLLERYDEALADFDRAVELDPEYAWAIASRGQTYQAMERYEEALADFTRAIELDPEWGWALVERARTYLQRDRHDEALADLTRAIEISPEHARAHAYRGFAHSMAGRQDQALTDFDRAIELVPDVPFYLGGRAMVHDRMRRYDEALTGFTQAIELDSGYDWAIASRGRTYRLMLRYDEALADFARAIEIDPECDWAIAERGETYRLMRRYDEALADFTRAIEIDPEYDWALASRGQTYLALGRYDEALADLDRAIGLNAAWAWAMAERARVRRRLGRYDEAARDLDRAIELDPRELDYRAERALTRAEPGDGDRYQYLVDVDATADEAAALGEAVMAWLVAEGVVEEPVTGCVPGTGGHAPGPSRATAATGKVPVDRPFHGVTVEDDDDVFPSLPVAAATCPSCGARHELRRGGRPTAFTENLVDALDGDLLCPACGREGDVKAWTFAPPWATGHLAVAFWNWPPLRTEFVDAVSARLGHRVVLVSGVL